MKFDPDQLTNIAGSIVGFATGSATATAIGTHLPRQTIPQRIVASIGTFGVGLVVGAVTKRETERTINEVRYEIESNNAVVIPIRTP